MRVYQTQQSINVFCYSVSGRLRRELRRSPFSEQPLSSSARRTSTALWRRVCSASSRSWWQLKRPVYPSEGRGTCVGKARYCRRPQTQTLRVQSFPSKMSLSLPPAEHPFPPPQNSYVSCVLGCPYEGKVAPAKVAQVSTLTRVEVGLALFSA